MSDDMRRLWWLSFVDPAKSAPRAEQVPGGGGFLGVAIVRAAGPTPAIVRAWELGINPGGEVNIYELPPEAESELEGYIERTTLLTAEEALAL